MVLLTGILRYRFIVQPQNGVKGVRQIKTGQRGVKGAQWVKLQATKPDNFSVL